MYHGLVIPQQMLLFIRSAGIEASQSAGSVLVLVFILLNGSILKNIQDMGMWYGDTYSLIGKHAGTHRDELKFGISQMNNE